MVFEPGELPSQMMDDGPGLRQIALYLLSCLLQACDRGTQRLDAIGFEHQDSALEDVLVFGDLVQVVAQLRHSAVKGIKFTCLIGERTADVVGADRHRRPSLSLLFQAGSAEPNQVTAATMARPAAGSAHWKPTSVPATK